MQKLSLLQNINILSDHLAIELHTNLACDQFRIFYIGLQNICHGKDFSIISGMDLKSPLVKKTKNGLYTTLLRTV